DFTGDGIADAITQNTWWQFSEPGTYPITLTVTRDTLSNTVSKTLVLSDEPEDIPLQYGLIGNYPNPFNPETVITFRLRESGAVTLAIYNIRGEIVKKLIDSTLTDNYYEESWNCENEEGEKVSAGVYFYRLSTDRETYIKKMLLLK
ncbi:MAG: T9SS type A sorting domain-containing protein, partial [Candidatus Cloacimonetes bacterium]|nr:T9SS type A sorting domain-containing protein [Candidatus Cloacimonadota bacterium]